MTKISNCITASLAVALVSAGTQAATVNYRITALGFSDAEHTRGTDGYKYSITKFLNEAGQAAGDSQRYDGNNNTGQTAWLYTVQTR